MADDKKVEVPNDLVEADTVYLHNQGGSDAPTDLIQPEQPWEASQVSPMAGALTGAGVKVLGQPAINALARKQLNPPNIVTKDGLTNYAKAVFGEDALGGSTQSRIQRANKVALGEKIKTAGQTRGPGVRLGGSQLAPEKTIAEKVLSHVPEKSHGVVRGTGTVLGRGIAGAASGFDVADAWNRVQEGDYLGATVSGIGALGGLAALAPHPIVKGVGTAISMGAPILNTYLDKTRVEKQRGFAEGGEVQHFDEGGGAYVGYPQIHNRPRKQGYLSGLIEGATGLGDSENMSVLDPNAQAYMRGKDIGEPLGLAAMIPVNPASAVRGTAKFLAPKAASMAENYMVRQGLISPIVGEAAKPAVNRLNMHYKDVTKRIPELQESAQNILAGTGTREGHEALVNSRKPVLPFEFIPKPATREEAINALHKDKKALYGVPSQTLQAGHPVGLRLDIPAYSDHGVWVPTIHEQGSGFGAGKTIGHESVASVLNPSFGMSEKAALSIAAGKPKGTIATIKGEWNPVNQEQAVANAQDYLNHPEWRQVGMDPERHGYFYDRATMEPITSAEEALQIGPLVLARKPVYGKKEDFKFSEGGEVQHFKEGNQPDPTRLSPDWKDIKFFNGIGNPIENVKQNVSGALDTISKIPGNLSALVRDPVAYTKNLPAPSMEQMVNALSPAHVGGAFLGTVGKAPKILKASEAYAPHEGKIVHVTQSDRLKATEGELGGHEFSGHQLTKPEYAEANAAWGVASPQEATKIINRNKKVPEGQSLWTPLIGSETQHQTNPHVFDPMLAEFYRQIRLGNLSPETAEKMQAQLAKQQFTNGPRKGQLQFPNLPEITNEEAIRQLANTFENRGPLADILFGAKGAGKTKGQIIDYQGMLQDMADPRSIGAPTHSLGTRLFSLDNNVIYRPDLHSAFPHILTGTDQGVSYSPIPKELGLDTYIQNYKDFTGQEPGTWAFTRKPVSFQVTDKLLRKWEEAGHKEGGLV